MSEPADRSVIAARVTALEQRVKELERCLMWVNVVSARFNPNRTTTTQIMSEIRANPREREDLRRASQQIREGSGRWLEDDENPSEAV